MGKRQVRPSAKGKLQSVVERGAAGLRDISSFQLGGSRKAARIVDRRSTGLPTVVYFTMRCGSMSSTVFIGTHSNRAAGARLSSVVWRFGFERAKRGRE